MKYELKTETKELTITVEQEECPMNPREYQKDNNTLVMFDCDYTIGDIDKARPHHSLEDEAEIYQDFAIWYPVYLSDYSHNLTIEIANRDEYNKEPDGIIGMTPEQVKKYKSIEEARNVLKQDIKCMDYYLRGYHYMIRFEGENYLTGECYDDTIGDVVIDNYDEIEKEVTTLAKEFTGLDINLEEFEEIE